MIAFDYWLVSMDMLCVCVQVLGTRKLMLVTHEEFEKV